MLSDIFQFELI